METIELRVDRGITKIIDKEFSIAIGFFDGLHKGHQTVIQQAISTSQKLDILPAVMTFNPHPSHLFSGEIGKIGYITPLEEKQRILSEMGIDTLFIVEFDHNLASLTPEEFVDQVLRNLNVRHVTAGFDFTFGAKGKGNMEQMASLANGDYGTTIVEKVAEEDDKISSTRIRKLLADGEVAKTASLLGRPFRSIGTVIDGDKRGRLLGFPTANIVPGTELIVPQNGVYAVRFTVDGIRYDGVCNIGVKPTFDHRDEARKTIEVNVFDFDGDLYGKKAIVDWIDHIRPEQKFDSIDMLINQIAEDKETAKKILSKKD
ncbi:bifunctional riboflavin kinase/FAD synthetase [Sporosarcina sp. BI001-red]|uniref:bifunctional riboflavin kinase/FAD synthetase n=1 Tax=Sporosarcina sp. BI001-red TaxID=2282866 RepID=UPI000E236AFE|nr:bifunctional riboflavin kinase/FAD synthetase [Sporosarcina sp. BI001-red]REB09798.1 bifunctional riboflavin kinase/FAD synthetase [Sporosarcina sp. BI001-red]